MKRRTKLIAGGLVAAVGIAAISAAVVAQGPNSSWCPYGGYGQKAGYGYGQMMGGRGMGRGAGMMGRGGMGMGPGAGMFQQADTLFKQFDADKDDAVSKQELDAGFAAMHAKTDVNGDGKVSVDEFGGLWTQFTRGHMVDKFQMLDDDGDAAITADEFKTPFEYAFQRHDLNDDGKLTRDEFWKRGRGPGPKWRYYEDDDDKNDDDYKRKN